MGRGGRYDYYYHPPQFYSSVISLQTRKIFYLVSHMSSNYWNLFCITLLLLWTVFNLIIYILVGHDNIWTSLYIIKCHMIRYVFAVINKQFYLWRSLLLVASTALWLATTFELRIIFLHILSHQDLYRDSNTSTLLNHF